MAPLEKPEVRKIIVRIIAEELKVDESAIHEGMTLEELGADSVDMVQIIMKLEEQFGIEINDQEAENMKTFADIVDYVYGKQKK
jgi:acyl carrier protein